MEQPIDAFDLHKFLIRLYEDKDIISEFSEVLYNILDQYRISKFCFDDLTKSITISLDDINMEYRLSTINMISVAFSSYILKIVRSPEFHFLIDQSDIQEIDNIPDTTILQYALQCITILDLSTEFGKAVFKINLKN